jgi:hypothetical protein
LCSSPRSSCAGAALADGPKPAFLPWFSPGVPGARGGQHLGFHSQSPPRRSPRKASALLLLYAVTALGLATSWRELKAIGWGLFGLILTLTIILAGLALAAVRFLL